MAVRSGWLQKLSTRAGCGTQGIGVRERSVQPPYRAHQAACRLIVETDDGNFWGSGLQEEKTRNGILSTLSVNPPQKQRMSFRQRSVTYVKSFLRAFTREKRYPTCFKFRFVSSPPTATGFPVSQKWGKDTKVLKLSGSNRIFSSKEE